jgi:hypothetical protein
MRTNSRGPLNQNVARVLFGRAPVVAHSRPLKGRGALRAGSVNAPSHHCAAVFKCNAFGAGHAASLSVSDGAPSRCPLLNIRSIAASMRACEIRWPWSLCSDLSGSYAGCAASATGAAFGARTLLCPLLLLHVTHFPVLPTYLSDVWPFLHGTPVKKRLRPRARASDRLMISTWLIPARTRPAQPGLQRPGPRGCR